jgi:hypothetical protein
MKKLVANLPRLSAVAVLSVSMASCGYALAGRGNTLPASIQVIGVPPFVNHTAYPDIDRLMTDAAVAEFQSKGKYKVQPEAAGVDGLLTVTIVGLEPRVTSFTAERLPSGFSIVVTASVEFKNLDDNSIIWSNPYFRVTDEYQLTGDENVIDITASFTQNTNAQERIAKKFARDVVTAIFEAF